METEFICSQCRKVLYESERRLHISAEHLDYFPFGCPFCKKENKKHLETTETDMNQHISAYHNGNNLGIVLLKDPAKEIELNDMIEQCRRLPIQQISTIESSEMRRVLNSLDSAGTSAVNGNAVQNGSDLTQAKDEVDSDDIGIGVPNNTLDAILPEQAAQIETDEPNEQSVARPITQNSPITENSPNTDNSETPNAFLPKTERLVNISIVPETDLLIPPVVVKTEQIVVDPTPNSENNSTTNAVTLAKPEPPETVSTVPVRLRLEAALSSYVPIDIEANDEPHNFSTSTKETNFLNQRTSNKKRRLPDNIPGDPSGPKRRQNDNQLTSGSHSSHEDHNIATSGNQDTKDKNAAMSHRNEHPATSAQITKSNAPADASKKEIITKLSIVLSNGMVCFETIDRRKHDYAPLSKYLPTLRKSVLSTNGCEVAMQFYPYDLFHISFGSPSRYGKYCHKEFADQIHSIAFLWTDFTITARFGHYRKGSDEMPSQSDYCSELFGPSRSVFKCKKLSIALENYWPLSIVTNVANDCDECELKLTRVDYYDTICFSDEEFLTELYERDVLQRVAVTMHFLYNDHKAANDFIKKLKERFAHAPHKRFKFVMCTQSTNVRQLSLQIQDSTLEAKAVRDSAAVVIEQRATRS